MILGGFKDILGWFGKCWDVLGCFGDVLGRIGMFLDVLGHFRTFLENFGGFLDLLGLFYLSTFYFFSFVLFNKKKILSSQVMPMH